MTALDHPDIGMQLIVRHHVVYETVRSLADPANISSRRAIAEDAIAACRNGVGRPSREEVDELEVTLAHGLAVLRTALVMDGENWQQRLITENQRRAPDDNAGIFSWAFTPDGMLWLDACAADYLERLGKYGANLAGTVRKLSKERFVEFSGLQLRFPALDDSTVDEQVVRVMKPWCGESPPHMSKAVAAALWRDVVEPAIKERQRKQPALALAFYDDVGKTMVAGGHVKQGVLYDRRGNRVTEVARVDRPLELPALDMEQAEALIIRGGGLLGSVISHRLMRWEVRAGHAQVQQGTPDARKIRIHGGWEKLAEDIGTALRNVEDVRALVHAQAHLPFTFGRGVRGNMLSYLYFPEARGRRAEVRLILGEALLPSYVFDLAKSTQREREARRLVPVVDLPPLIGRPNEYGPQCAFQARLVAEMRRRATELVEHGGVRFDPDELEQIAASVELPTSMVARVIDRWRQDGDDGPAFVEVVEPDRYTLASAHAPARNFLLQSGKMEIDAAKAGRRGAAVRRRTRRRKSGGPG